MQKLGENAYEILFPPNISNSPIFNVSDLTLFKGDVGTNDAMQDTNEIQEELIKDIPPSQSL